MFLQQRLNSALRDFMQCTLLRMREFAQVLYEDLLSQTDVLLLTFHAHVTTFSHLPLESPQLDASFLGRTLFSGRPINNSNVLQKKVLLREAYACVSTSNAFEQLCEVERDTTQETRIYFAKRWTRANYRSRLSHILSQPVTSSRVYKRA